MELVTSNTPSVEHIVRLLTSSINTNCGESHALASYAELWAEYADETAGKPRVSEWLSNLQSTEDSPLSGTLALNSALAGLLRLQAAFNTSQAQEDRAYSLHSRAGPAQASINIAEETIDRAMRAVSTFLNVNFLNTLGGGSGEKDTVGKQGSGKGKGAKNKGDGNTRAVADVVSSLLCNSVFYMFFVSFQSGFQRGNFICELTIFNCVFFFSVALPGESGVPHGDLSAECAGAVFPQRPPERAPRIVCG